MKPKLLNKIFIYLFFIILTIVVICPLIWIFLMSFKDNLELFGGNSFSIPQKWDAINYKKALTAYPIGLYFVNSVIYTVSSILVTLLLSSMFAYAISRMRFRGSRFLQNYIVLGLIIPVQAIIIPIFMLEKNMGILNTYLSLILPYSAFSISVGTLMFSAFFKSIPFEMEESAFMDGCGVFTAFFKIIFPMVKTAISTLVIWLFITRWNEFFIAYIFINQNKLKTLPLGVLSFMTSTTIDWGAMSASMIIASIPLILIYMFFTNKVEEAFTAGALLK